MYLGHGIAVAHWHWPKAGWRAGTYLGHVITLQMTGSQASSVNAFSSS